MVQRKSPDKVGIKADDSTNTHLKSDKKWRSTALKSSSSCSHADMKNKSGAELKKIMKKSGSFKRSDFDSLASYSYPSRSRAKSRIERPSVSSSTPRKLSQIKASDGSPNYMKSTSCSTARKECLQVNPNGLRTSSDGRGQGRNDSNRSKVCSTSGHKPVKALCTANSLRPVRTLTKTSSLKAGRPLMKKNSRVALCPEQNVGRATCSSTLKDSKFPSYVMLHPGGTEAEGTSVMKVCPYNYCSLNGHHHAQLPPLKRFLSVRRRLMKTQKSMRLKAVSPVEIKSSEEKKKEIDTEQMLFNGNPALMEEVNLDFFVEIYAPPRKENTELSAGVAEGGTEEAKMMDSVINLQVLKDGPISVDDDEEAKLGNHGGREDESLLDELSCSELSFEEDLDQNYDVMEAADVDDSMVFPKQIQQESIEDSYCPNFFVQVDMDLEAYSFDNESKSESPAESELYELNLEASNMDWEDEQHLGPYLDNGTDHFTIADDEADFELQHKNVFHEELPANDEQQVAQGEINGSFDAGSLDGSDSEFSDGDQISEIDMSGDLSSDDFEEPTSIEDDIDEDTQPDNFEFSSVPLEYPLEEPTVADYCLHEHILLEDEKSAGPTNVEDEQQVEEHECNSHEDEQQAEEQECNSHEDEQNMDDSMVQEDSDIDAQDGHPLHDSENVSDGAEENEKAEGSNCLPEIQDFGSSQVTSETNEDTVMEDQYDEAKDQSISSSTYSEEQNDLEGKKSKSAKEIDHENDKHEMEDKAGIDAAEVSVASNAGSGSDEQLLESCSNFYKPNRCMRLNKDCEEQRKLNWQEPHYLPVEPDQEAEKVDLKHQMMDERKNAEEWMLDYALRQTVNKLAPARKRKVALLVEAFETVTPLPKWESRLQHTSNAFAHTRFIQACN